MRRAFCASQPPHLLDPHHPPGADTHRLPKRAALFMGRARERSAKGCSFRSSLWATLTERRHVSLAARHLQGMESIRVWGFSCTKIPSCAPRLS